MTARHLEILRHSLGLNEKGKGGSYRNFFVAGGPDEAVCLELQSYGLMYEGTGSASNCGRVFHVSKAGEFVAAGEP